MKKKYIILLVYICSLTTIAYAMEQHTMQRMRRASRAVLALEQMHHEADEQARHAPHEAHDEAESLIPQAALTLTDLAQARNLARVRTLGNQPLRQEAVMMEHDQSPADMFSASAMATQPSSLMQRLEKRKRRKLGDSDDDLASPSRSLDEFPMPTANQSRRLINPTKREAPQPAVKAQDSDASTPSDTHTRFAHQEEIMAGVFCGGGFLAKLLYDRSQQTQTRSMTEAAAAGGGIVWGAGKVLLATTGAIAAYCALKHWFCSKLEKRCDKLEADMQQQKQTVHELVAAQNRQAEESDAFFGSETPAHLRALIDWNLRVTQQHDQRIQQGEDDQDQIADAVEHNARIANEIREAVIQQHRNQETTAKAVAHLYRVKK